MVYCLLQSRKLDHLFLLIEQRSHQLFLVGDRFTSSPTEKWQLVMSFVQLCVVADIDIQVVAYRTVDIHLPHIRESRWIDPLENTYNKKIILKKMINVMIVNIKMTQNILPVGSGRHKAAP
jgi:hypothetical protein